MRVLLASNTITPQDTTKPSRRSHAANHSSRSCASVRADLCEWEAHLPKDAAKVGQGHRGKQISALTACPAWVIWANSPTPPHDTDSQRLHGESQPGVIDWLVRGAARLADRAQPGQEPGKRTQCILIRLRAPCARTERKSHQEPRRDLQCCGELHPRRTTVCLALIQRHKWCIGTD